jgi:hypothetical protein
MMGDVTRKGNAGSPGSDGASPYLTRFQDNSAVPGPPAEGELVHFRSSPATVNRRC